MKLADLLRLAARSRRAQERLAAVLGEREAERAAAAAALEAAVAARAARVEERDLGGQVLYAGLLAGPRSRSELAAVETRLAELSAAVARAEAGIAAARSTVQAAALRVEAARRDLRAATRDTEKWELAAAERRNEERRALARRAQARADGQAVFRTAIVGGMR